MVHYVPLSRIVVKNFLEFWDEGEKRTAPLATATISPRSTHASNHSVASKYGRGPTRYTAGYSAGPREAGGWCDGNGDPAKIPVIAFPTK